MNNSTARMATKLANQIVGLNDDLFQIVDGGVAVKSKSTTKDKEWQEAHSYYGMEGEIMCPAEALLSACNLSFYESGDVEGQVWGLVQGISYLGQWNGRGNEIKVAALRELLCSSEFAVYHRAVSIKRSYKGTKLYHAWERAGIDSSWAAAVVE